MNEQGKQSKRRPTAQKTNLSGDDRHAGFAEAFPEITHCSVEVEESGRGVHDRNCQRRYRSPQVPPWLDCHNPLCDRGGLDLRAVIGEMVRNRVTHQQDAATCLGCERSANGRTVYRQCANSFSYTISIRYEAT
jgi:hypothetical protein